MGKLQGFLLRPVLSSGSKGGQGARVHQTIYLTPLITCDVISESDLFLHQFYIVKFLR